MEMRGFVFAILIYFGQLDRSLCEPPLKPVTSSEPPYSMEQSGPRRVVALPEYPGETPSADASRNHRQRTSPQHSPPSNHTYGSDCTRVFCSDPLTLTPLGLPCACVLPMKVELELEVAPMWVFTLVAELAVEIAAGTYMKQSQVRIISAVSCGQNQEKSRVVIYLVPLGRKFDNTTAFLLYERFWQKEIPLNVTVFGDYKVISIHYPGLPASIPSMEHGSHQLPFAARLPSQKTHNLSPRTAAVVISSSLSFVILCAIVAFTIFKLRKLSQPPGAVGPTFASSINKCSGTHLALPGSTASSASQSLVSTMTAWPSFVRSFTLAQLAVATNNFSSLKVLGEGGFGCVYLGIIDSGVEVAVKLFKRHDLNGNREFIAEVEMLSRLHHRNLVKLLGVCTEGSSRCLVYELVPNGSVESHLHGADKERGPLDWDTRIKIALGSARALAYLHEDSNPRVIHRDFKASNILLEDDFNPRVSDFGLARVAAEGNHYISTHVMGTFGYVAPEYAMTGHLLVKSDVYSYGVVLLELLSGRKPVDMSQAPGQENLVTWARPLLLSREGLEQLVDPSLGGKYEFDSLAKVAAIASMCVQPEVSNRPFMGEVIQALKLISSETDEAYRDFNSRNESCLPECSGSKGESGTEASWWDGGTTPRCTVGGIAPYLTMDYSSGPLDGALGSQPSPSPFFAARMNALERLNGSGPLRVKRHRHAFAKLRGSVSEHGFLSRRFAPKGYWS